MTTELPLSEMTALTWERIRPALERALPSDPAALQRLEHLFPDFFAPFHALYGAQFDFHYHVEQTLLAAAAARGQRSDALRDLDDRRLAEPAWFSSEAILGAVCYVDRWAGTLSGLKNRIPYLQELGVTYLHLMPLYLCPQPHNDGGYAVSDFRTVNPALGTIDELEALAAELRTAGISLVLDFVFNHTSDEHTWARHALAGDRRFQRYYRMFPDRVLPDLYEPQLREIFPDQAPGSFTFRAEIDRWVWTTFYPFQWDLNYANPDVFRAMFEEMAYLANRGVEVLRLDAVPFVWKELGTPCENLPQVHLLLQAYRALMRAVAPAVAFKSEAIVHPRDVRSYISPAECELSYNPIMMVSLWEAAATRDARFMTHTLQKQFPLPAGTAWLNYLRSHDDIGWGFADEDAEELFINGPDHRRFLNQFYSGAHPGSFARGLPFNYNPRTQDMRISGTLASLAGLEEAVERSEEVLITRAVDRILMLFGVVIAAGGIPLIYLGDEYGTLNDYSYTNEPEKAADSRWVHRPAFETVLFEQRHDSTRVPGRIFTGLSRMIAIRKAHSLFAGSSTHFPQTDSPHIFALQRADRLVCLFNFSDSPSVTDKALYEPLRSARTVRDLITDVDLPSGFIQLHAYQTAWLLADAPERVST